MITSDQLRAARALLRLDQAELARRAHVSVITVRRLEGARAMAGVSPVVLEDVRHVLEEAGVEFIPRGVRRRVADDTTTLLADLQAISHHSAAALAGHDLLTDEDLYGDDGLPL